MVQSMEDLERTWNHKFNYPWTFFNDVPFTEEFKKKTSAVTKAKCNYGIASPATRCRKHRANHYNRNHPRRALGKAIMDRRRRLSSFG